MDLTQISAETLDQIKKAATSGVTIGTGLHGVDLSGLVSLIPVNTPFYDKVSKSTAEQGAQFAQWEVLLNVNSSQPDPATAFDYAAALANIEQLDVASPFGKVGSGYTVTQDAINRAKGYADAKAIAVFNALNQYKIGMDKKLLGAQSFALATPGTPTVAASTTGGTIAASTAVAVKVAARTLSNYHFGGSTKASAAGSVTTGSGTATNSVTASVTAVPGAVAYDWYVGTYYVTTTTVNTVVITAVPSSNASVPNLPGLYSTAPTEVPTTDSSAKANDFNGLLATLTGDYANAGSFGQVTNGSGVSSGAVFQSLDGSPLTVNGGNVSELDAFNEAIYANVEMSVDAYMMSSQTASAISSALLTTSAGTQTMFAPNVVAERQDVVAGGFVSWYINKADGGTPIRIEIQPHLAPGTIIGRTDSVPFPNSNITNTLEQRDQYPVADYEYAASRIAGQAGGGPRFDGETFSTSALINRAPVAMGVVANIGL